MLNQKSEQKRVFFAFEAMAPWPEALPQGRLLEAPNRHLTFAFLGQTDYPSLEEILPSFPKPPFKVGMVGKFNECVFLPPKRPNVVAWQIEWLDQNYYDLDVYQKEVANWLQCHNFSVRIHKNRFLPHITITRRPFEIKEWKKAFRPLPVMIQNIHLYESLEALTYRPCWTYPVRAPFEEIEHAADVAFLIRGETLSQLHYHAIAALSFLSPSLLSYISQAKQVENLDDIIIDLNDLITQADQEEGIPFKAVSFHGEIIEEKDQTLMWEMIVDV